MKKFLIKITPTLILLGFCLPLVAFADDVKLEPPITGVTDVNVLAANIIKAFLGVVGVVSLIMFIYGGFMLLVSGGSPERVTKGRQTLLWATLGLVVIFGSYGIVRAVFNIITAGKIK